MDEEDDKPNVTISFHDDHPPVGPILDSLRQALKVSHEVRFVRVESEQGADDPAKFLFRMVPKQMQMDGEDDTTVRSFRSDREKAHCDLLDGLDTPNGFKAIAIALRAHWSEQHRARFGEAANPATVKRWRTERSSGRSRRGATTDVRADGWTNARRIVRRLRMLHAIRVDGSGTRMRDGYRQALAELDVVNAGGHGGYGDPGGPLPSFSYETFRRDCLEVRSGRRRGPSPRRGRR